MVADGYKKTEIGVIPVEWEVVKLQDYIKLTSGKFNPKKNLQDEKNDNFAYPVYGGNGITGFFTDYLVSNPTIIIGRVGEYCGSVHLEKKSIWITDNAIYTKEISPNFNIDFLYETFGLIGLETLAERTGQPKITQEPIYNLKIPLPPLKEQAKIADILSTADEKIDAIDGQIKKAETLKKGLLQKLLSEGIGHSEFKDSELGKIPESWEVGKLEDVLTIKYGKSQKDVEDINGDYPILGTGGIMGYANNYLCDKPSVLIGRKGTIDKPQYMETPFWTVDTLFYTELKKDILPKFVYYIFQTIPWKKYNEASGVPSLSKPNIHNIATVLLPLKEQKQIAEILSTADEKLEVLRAKKEKYETLKKGLLQKLLSGEVRV